MNKLYILLGLVAILIVGGKSSLFVLTEGRQAIITEFGKPVGDPIKEAGLHFKTPFVQEVLYVDKRILIWDGMPNQIPTKDKKYISVDTTARWKIVDVLKFIQTVRNEIGAKGRLDDILDSVTRDVISNHNLVETVRNSDQIIDKLKKSKSKSEEMFGEVEPITIGRENLSKMIIKAAKGELEALGIELIDLQIRRISYERTVEQKVYDRMISERQRIAQKIRSTGEGEKQKIQGRLKRDLQRITSEAYKTTKIIRGKAEAKAAAIYAKTYSKAPKFYDFVKSLEAYKKSLKGKAKFIISTDNEFLKYFKRL